MGRTTYREREEIRRLNQLVRRCNRNHRRPGSWFQNVFNPSFGYGVYRKLSGSGYIGVNKIASNRLEN